MMEQELLDTVAHFRKALLQIRREAERRSSIAPPMTWAQARNDFRNIERMADTALRLVDGRGDNE